MIPYNQACVLGVGLPNVGKNLISYEITSYVRVLDSREIISYEITSYVRVLDSREMEVSLLLIRRTSYYCTDSYPAISFLIHFLPNG